MFVRTISMDEDSEDNTSTDFDDEIAYELTTQAVSRDNTVGAFLKNHSQHQKVYSVVQRLL